MRATCTLIFAALGVAVAIAPDAPPQDVVAGAVVAGVAMLVAIFG